jgi:tetratricopeptide (TPR) repeat protein
VRLLKKDRQMLAYTLSEERNLYADMVLGELQDAEVAPERAREITRGILQRALLNEHVSPAEFGYVSARAEATGKTGGFESHRRRGALFLLTGEYAKAEEQFTSAIELPYARAREKAEAYVYRGCARARRGSYKDAIADLDLGLKYDRSGRLDAIISVFRGFALLRLEKYCEATAPLRHAIELGLSSPASHAYLGLAELAQGNIEVASDELDKAARLDPYFVETYDYQAKLFEAIGDKEKAKHARTRAEHIRAGARRIGRGTDPDRG